VPSAGTVLVALSGGADSVALLLGLHHLSGELGFQLRAAHLHHGLRGPDADRDLAFVRALCRRLRVPLAWRAIDARARMRERGLAGQAGLRTLRREFLVAAAAESGAVAIATGHHADDQLETLLMRLARGTGLAGLGGIRPRRGRWIRPLLHATRSEIEDDLRAAGQPWREDRSNQDPAYLRNRLRGRAIPALVAAIGGPRRGGDRLARNAARAASEIQGAERLLGRRARRVLSRASSIQSGEFALDRGVVAAYPPSFQRMVLRQLWTRLVPLDPGLTHSHLTLLLRLIGQPRPAARIRLPAGWTAGSNRGTIVFRRA
jgi:tRNA(Ile)-lysidine synthase